ncbi:MAG TPA: NADH:flavin oxidoreductase [Novosphingobium sp.]|nr:NADH:flavin oxidoreductase [Novosphingobium sp.]
MRNRLALAPLTNLQSNDDGTLSADELTFLRLRAESGFGMVMTCGATVHPLGKGYPRQLGIHSDIHLPGLEQLAAILRRAGALSAVQIMHSGWRSKRELIGQDPVGVCDDTDAGVRGLSTGEVQQVVEDFILAGLRAEAAGFDGVEVHGAHGYLLCEFLDTQRNRRTDCYGGSAEGRARIIWEILSGLRARCRPDFQIGVRLSPERYGIDFGEARSLVHELMHSGMADYIDLSCWDTFKEPEDARFKGRAIMDWFTELPRGNTRLGVAGKLTSGPSVVECLRRGADFVLIGRGAILHHDFPRRLSANPSFTSVSLPVSRAHLHAEGLGEHFIDYMATWEGFVAD